MKFILVNANKFVYRECSINLKENEDFEMTEDVNQD